MIISFVIDTEYMGIKERNKWFLKCVSEAMKEDMIIVTHSYFRDHLQEVIDECSDRFYEQFEIDKYSVEDIRKLNICYIPDEWFERIYLKYKSRTKQLLYLYNEIDSQMMNYVSDYINNVLLSKGGVEPDYILNCLHVFEFVRALSKRFSCPIIPWVFSAIRKVHGYSQTLYMAHIDNNLFNSNACKKMFAQSSKVDMGYSLFSKKEILAMLGKMHNFQLIPMVDASGSYDIGVIGEGFNLIPETYQSEMMTDDDIYYECKRLFSSNSIISRVHPIQLDRSGVGRNHMKNDPAAFILRCRRLVTLQSQMILKAAMWNRSSVVMSDALPYAFLFNDKLIEDKPIDDYNLNFLLFAYLVPDKCMFSKKYWIWRMTSPKINEIIKCHLDTIFDDLSIPKKYLQNSIGRLESILLIRGASEREINCILNTNEVNDVPEVYPSSCLRCIMMDKRTILLYCLNHNRSDYIYSHFYIPKGCKYCEFIPQFDLDGYISIKEASINNINIETEHIQKYYPKNTTVLSVEVNNPEEASFTAIWNGRQFS